MREILFRGKRKKNGEWICGDLWNKPYAKEVVCIVSFYDDTGTTGGVEVIPSTVGQFTGLTDKNGEKIFEGDIVNGLFCFGLILKSVVHFKDGVFGIVTEYMGAKRFDGFNTICNVEFEVIGNIHDNPELLEVSK